MKKLVLAAAALLLATTAYAAEMKFPSDAPVASVTFPDTWKPQETDTGIDVTSPDDSIYLAIDATGAKDAATAVKEAVEYFKAKGVSVDDATLQQTQQKLNGMDYATATWGGTDADGPVTISLGVLVLGPDSSLVLSYWGTQGAQDQMRGDIVGIVNSMKPAG